MFGIQEIPFIVLIMAGVVLVVMQYIKKIPVFSSEEAKKFLPRIAAVLGVIFTIAYQMIFEGASINTFHEYIAQGFATGLASSGGFSFLKGTFMGKPKSEKIPTEKSMYDERGEL